MDNPFLHRPLPANWLTSWPNPALERTRGPACSLRWVFRRAPLSAFVGVRSSMNGSLSVWFWFVLPFAAVSFFVLARIGREGRKPFKTRSAMARYAPTVVLVVLIMSSIFFWLDRHTIRENISGYVVSRNPDTGSRRPYSWLCTAKLDDGNTITDHCSSAVVGDRLTVCRTTRLMSRIRTYDFSTC